MGDKGILIPEGNVPMSCCLGSLVGRISLLVYFCCMNGSGNFVQGIMAGNRVSRRCGSQIGAGLQEILPLMSANMWKPAASD